MEEDNSNSHGQRFGRGIGKRTAVLSVMLMLLFSLVLVVSANGVRAIGPSVTDIDEDTVWDLAGSPYYVTSDITIKEGSTLTIQAGVQVIFDPGTCIYVEGTLLCKGTETQRILMTGVGWDGWEGLFFEETSSGSSLYGVDFRYAYAPVWAEDCDLDIADCSFVDGTYGVVWRSEECLEIESCYFDNLWTAVVLEDETVCLEMSDSEINDCYEAVQALTPEDLADSISIEIAESCIRNTHMGVIAVADEYLNLNICDTIFEGMQAEAAPEPLVADMAFVEGMQTISGVSSVLGVSFGSMDAVIRDCDFLQVLAGPILLDFPGECDYFFAEVSDCDFADVGLSLLCGAVVFDNQPQALEGMNGFSDQLDPEFLADLGMLGNVQSKQTETTEDETPECCQIEVDIQILNNHFLRSGPVVTATLVLVFESDWNIAVNEMYSGNEFHAPVCTNAQAGMPVGWFSSVLLGAFVDSQSSVTHTVEMGNNEIEGGSFLGFALSGIWVTDNVVSIDATVQRTCDVKIHDNNLTGAFFDGVRAVARSVDFETSEMEDEFCVSSTVNFEIKNNAIEMSGIMGPFFEHVFEDGPAGIYVLVSDFAVMGEANATNSGTIIVCGNKVTVREEGFLAEGIHVKQLTHALGGNAKVSQEIPVSVGNNEVETEANGFVGDGIVIERSAAAPCGFATAKISGDITVSGNTILANIALDNTFGIEVTELAFTGENATAQICGNMAITGNDIELSGIMPLVGVYVLKDAQAYDGATAGICGDLLVADNYLNLTAVASPVLLTATQSSGFDSLMHIWVSERAYADVEATAQVCGKVAIQGNTMGPGAASTSVFVDLLAYAEDQATAQISGDVSVTCNSIPQVMSNAIYVNQNVRSEGESSASITGNLLIQTNTVDEFWANGIVVYRNVDAYGASLGEITGDVSILANKITLPADVGTWYMFAIEVESYAHANEKATATVTQKTTVADNEILYPGYDESYGIYLEVGAFAYDEATAEFIGDVAVTGNKVEFLGDGYNYGISVERYALTDAESDEANATCDGAVLIENNEVSMEFGVGIYYHKDVEAYGESMAEMAGDVSIQCNNVTVVREVPCGEDTEDLVYENRNYGIYVEVFVNAEGDASIVINENIVVKGNEVTCDGHEAYAIYVDVKMEASYSSVLSYTGEIWVNGNTISMTGDDCEAIFVDAFADAYGEAELTVLSGIWIKENNVAMTDADHGFAIDVDIHVFAHMDASVSLDCFVTIELNSVQVSGDGIYVEEDCEAYDSSCLNFRSEVSILGNTVEITGIQEDFGCAVYQEPYAADEARLFFIGNLTVADNEMSFTGARCSGIYLEREAFGDGLAFVQVVGDVVVNDNLIDMQCNLGIYVDLACYANAAEEEEARALVQVFGDIYVLNNSVKMSVGTGIEIEKEAYAYENGVAQMCGFIRCWDNTVELSSGTGILIGIDCEAFADGTVQVKTEVCVKNNSVTITECNVENVCINVTKTVFVDEDGLVQLCLTVSITNNTCDTHNGWGIWTNVDDAYIMDNKVTGAAFGLFDDACHQTPKPPAEDDDGTINPGSDPVTPDVPPAEPSNNPGPAASSSAIDASALALIAAFLLIAGLGAFVGLRRLR